MGEHSLARRQIEVRASHCSGVVACHCGWAQSVGPFDSPVLAHEALRDAWGRHSPG